MSRYSKRPSTKVSRKSAPKKSFGRSLLIVTEGTNTEPIYFNQLKQLLASKLVYIETKGRGKNDPKQLVDDALDLQARQMTLSRKGKLGYQKPAKYDELWVVFDIDDLNQAQLNEGVAYAKKKGVSVSFSNPCFEFWILLHAESGYTTSCLGRGSDLEHRLKAAFALEFYSKEASFASNFMIDVVTTGNIQRAVDSVQRLKAHHKTAMSPQPPLPYTTVDKLIYSINESLPPFKKFLQTEE